MSLKLQANFNPFGVIDKLADEWGANRAAFRLALIAGLIIFPRTTIVVYILLHVVTSNVDVAQVSKDPVIHDTAGASTSSNTTIQG